MMNLYAHGAEDALIKLGFIKEAVGLSMIQQLGRGKGWKRLATQFGNSPNANVRNKVRRAMTREKKDISQGIIRDNRVPRNLEALRPARVPQQDMDWYFGRNGLNQTVPPPRRAARAQASAAQAQPRSETASANVSALRPQGSPDLLPAEARLRDYGKYHNMPVNPDKIYWGKKTDVPRFFDDKQNVRPSQIPNLPSYKGRNVAYYDGIQRYKVR